LQDQLGAVAVQHGRATGWRLGRGQGLAATWGQREGLHWQAAHGGEHHPLASHLLEQGGQRRVLGMAQAHLGQALVNLGQAAAGLTELGGPCGLAGGELLGLCIGIGQHSLLDQLAFGGHALHHGHLKAHQSGKCPPKQGHAITATQGVNALKELVQTRFHRGPPVCASLFTLESTKP
jgi:hypothetical protein